ncbi:DUF1659 domain-containing protein [Lactobacillus sp.]|uniref:DUF1659 domain-containing protein n=1 Tax=Lactobacillus sp. TaxID=1591 RepID=UPI003EF1EC42
MNFKLSSQNIQYTFKADKYKDGQMTRSLKDVKLDATPDSLVKVGKAISALQGDDLTELCLIQKQTLNVAEAENK